MRVPRARNSGNPCRPAGAVSRRRSACVPTEPRRAAARLREEALFFGFLFSVFVCFLCDDSDRPIGPVDAWHASGAQLRCPSFLFASRDGCRDLRHEPHTSALVFPCLALGQSTRERDPLRETRAERGAATDALQAGAYLYLVQAETV